MSSDNFDGITIDSEDVFIHNKTPYNFIGFDLLTEKVDNVCVCCLGKNKEFDSYLLPCGHTSHTRCFRKYINIVNKCVCPICNKFDTPSCCLVCGKKGYYICHVKCKPEFVKNKTFS